MRIAAAVGQVLALACVIAQAAVDARDADPLHSPECMQARAVLDRAQDDAARKKPGAMQRLAAARKEVSEACLGRDAPGRERAGAPDPPITVPPPVMQPPRAVSLSPPQVITPPPVPAVVPPGAITTCDPGGCWDSNGQRLSNLGPMIVGPRGPCTVQAGVARCP